MAKKKEAQLTYLQMPLPSASKSYRATKLSWGSLNYRQNIDTGALSMEMNISTDEAPYLTPSQRWMPLMEKEYLHPIGLFGFDDFLISIYRMGTNIKIDYITKDNTVYTGFLKEGDATEDDEYPRCVVQFNVYDTPTDPVGGKFIKKLLIFPDKKSMDFIIEEDGFKVSDMSVLIREYTNEEEEEDESGAMISPPPESANQNYYYFNTHTKEVYRYCEYETKDGGTAYGWKVTVPPTFPNIKYATVHLSRVFGVDDDRVYASGYNDYTNWNLDTVLEYNESNAWCSPAQSNTKAGGSFTGITTFQDHVICFKRDFMHEIYNTKNPFRLQDIYQEGAIDNRTIQDVDGRLIFVSGDEVKIYTGANPRDIGYPLNVSGYRNAVSGTDGKRYYLYCETDEDEAHIFVYDTQTGYWSETEVAAAVINFAHNMNGMYALCDDGTIYCINSGMYNHDWAFETDLMTNETVDIKHVKKIQMLAYLDDKATIDAYFLYDDEKMNPEAHHVCSLKGGGQKAIRVKPRNTAHYGVKLRIEGHGYVRLNSLELTFDYGGELHV